MRSFNAIIRLNLGTAAAFDQKEFPLEYYQQEGSFNKGSYLIKLTLDQVEEIRRLGIDLNNDLDFIHGTRLKMEDLRERRDRLLNNRKTRNPIKALLNYTDEWLFHAESKTLYRRTKTKSERIQREEQEHVQVVPRAQIRTIDEAVAPEALISGFSIPLPDGLNGNAEQSINDVMRMITKIANPFNDNLLISQLRDDEHEVTLANTESVLSQDMDNPGADETSGAFVSSGNLHQSRPTSPQTVNIHYQIIQNSVVTTNSSNLNGFTSNYGGERNSGASVTQEP